jgi:hypothetical protein
MANELSDYLGANPRLIDMMGVFQALRKLGFSADEIFMGALNKRLIVQLQTGGKAIGFDCGPFDGTPQDFIPIYERLTRLANQATQPELCATWELSAASRQGVRIVAAIITRGIEIPAPEALKN